MHLKMYLMMILFEPDCIQLRIYPNALMKLTMSYAAFYWKCVNLSQVVFHIIKSSIALVTFVILQYYFTNVLYDNILQLNHVNLNAVW